MNQSIFMLVGDMDTDKGGINRVMLSRSAMLADQYDISLLTLDFKTNYKEIEQKFAEMGRLHQSVNLLNIHDYYKKKFKINEFTQDQIEYYKRQSILYEDEFQVQDDEIYTNNCARYFINGIYKKYKKWSSEGELKHIDFFDVNRNRILREEFHNNGTIYRKRYYDFTYNKPLQDLFFTEDGHCYLNKWYKQNSKKIKYIFLINPRTGKVIKFDSNKDFNAYWLQELSLREIKKPIVICDGPRSAEVPLALRSEYIHKIFFIHSNHLDHPHIFGSEIRTDHQDILNNIDKADSIIVLTNTQKNEILEQFGNYNNLDVIPHSITPVKLTKSISKDEKLITMISRLHPEKYIDAAIKAFSKVIEYVPDAKLEIHGEGPDRNRLSKIINENNLTDNIFLKGFVVNVEEIFSKSLASLLTSVYEGLSLVTLESMACKTPMIAFDVNYGPRDIIKDGDNGYLVDFDDIDGLADKTIHLLDNPNFAKELGNNAYQYVHEHFNYETHKKQWRELLNQFKS